MDNRLFELATAIRKKKPWQWIAENELFGFVYNGETYYCSVMGAMGQHFAVGFYRGMSGLMGLRDMVLSDESLRSFEVWELGVKQDCLMCSFVSKDDANPEQLKAFKRYCKEAGKRIAGSNAYPLFESFIPYYVPRTINESEEAIMIYGLEVALKRIDSDVDAILPKIPMWNGKKWKIETLPEIEGRVYEGIEPSDEFTAHRIMKKRIRTVWGAKAIVTPTPFNTKKGTCFPTMIIMMDIPTGMMLMPILENMDREPETTEAMLENGVPDRLCVYDDRTEQLLRAYMERLGVQVVREEENEELDDCIEDMLEEVYEFGESDDEEFDDFYDGLVETPDDILRLSDDVLLGGYELFGEMLPEPWLQEMIDRGLIDE